jgi:hypothetical protein
LWRHHGCHIVLLELRWSHMHILVPAPVPTSAFCNKSCSHLGHCTVR